MSTASSELALPLALTEPGDRHLVLTDQAAGGGAGRSEGRQLECRLAASAAEIRYMLTKQDGLNTAWHQCVYYSIPSYS